MNKMFFLCAAVALAMLPACTSETDIDGRKAGMDSGRMTFTVDMPHAAGWIQQKGSRSAAETETPASVEMKGKVNGQTVYLQTEVTDGFPGDDPQALSRGTIVTAANKDAYMNAFGLTANVYNPKAELAEKPDGKIYFEKEKVVKDASGNVWSTEHEFFWPYGKYLSFYAWYPYEAEGLVISGQGTNHYVDYTVPEDVDKQADLMFATMMDQAEPTDATNLTFGHKLSAIRFVVGDELPHCIVKSITLKGIKYKGNQLFAASAWNVADDTKDFYLALNKTVQGTPGVEITAEDQTFFMLPQTLPDEAKVEIVLSDGSADFTVSASIGGTEWQVGNTYTYRISNNFVSLITSNDKFIAYTDAALTEQVTFLLSASATSAVSDGTITPSAGVTVEPTTFSSGAFNTPVKITWPVGTDQATLEVAFGGKMKTVELVRQAPTEADAFWLYSIPETTSRSLENDVLGVQNVSESDWIGFTASSTYTKDDYSQVVFDNSAGGDIYLQTLSIPDTDRFASLLATKESGNVMYCVEQKAITADFGFKGCERNISRESEKWNIRLSGGRLKSGMGALMARMVISSDVPDTQVSELGRDLTYGNPVEISSATGVSVTPYVKKRWDNLQNNTANNGTRKVNVQVKKAGFDEWFDVGSAGLMGDRFHWGRTFCIGYGQYHGHGSNWDNGAYQVVGVYYEIHQKHPMFGLHRWSLIADDYTRDTNTNPRFVVFNSARQVEGWNNGSIYRQGTSTEWSYFGTHQTVSVSDPDNPVYNFGGQFICTRVKGANFANTFWSNWNNNLSVWIPVVYTNSTWNKLEDGTTRTERPTDDAPIVGKSVDE